MLAHAHRRLGLSVVLGALLTTAAWAEPKLLARRADGQLEIGNESRLKIAGVRGTIRVKAGPPGQLRFLSTTPGDSPEDLPVELWSEGRRLWLQAPEGEGERPRELWVALPVELAVEIALDDSSLTLSDLEGGVEVAGTRLELSVLNVGGPVELELLAGTLKARRLSGDLALTGEKLAAEVSTVGGDVLLTLRDSRVGLSQVQGLVEGRVERTELTLEQLHGALRLEAEGGRVSATQLIAGGELRLAETPLALTGARGSVSIEGDAEMQLRDNSGALIVRSFGGPVLGGGNSGALDVEADGTRVSLEGGTGTVDVRGRGLEVGLTGIGGAIALRLSGSSASVEDAQADVDIDSEFGEVTVDGSSKDVRVKSRYGDVLIANANGAVEVDADTPRVEVAWASMSRNKNSTIKNTGGDVTVRLPSRGGCRLTAASRSGRIESEHPDVRVSEDREHASGLINRTQRPTLTIESDGDIYLRRGGAGDRGP